MNRKLSINLSLTLLIITTLSVAMSAQTSAAIDTTTAYLDFDVALPTLSIGQNVPFNQTSGNITAYFSSPSDVPAFSVQTCDESIKLSQFSGKCLFDNNPSRDILDIKFNVNVVAVNLTFATVELNKGGSIEPSSILIAGYENTSLVGTTKAQGSFDGSFYPQGTVSFSAGRPFNYLRISLPAQASGATDFLIDNIAVITFTSSSTTAISAADPTSPVLPIVIVIVVAALLALVLWLRRKKR